MIKKISQLLSYRLPQNLQKASRTSLIILSLICLVFCKKLSAYLCNYNSEIWFEYFTVIERTSLFLLVIATMKYIKTFSWICAELLFCFLAQDLIDRIFLNIKEITVGDYITIGILITISIIKYKNDNIRKNNNFKLV